MDHYQSHGDQMERQHRKSRLREALRPKNHVAMEVQRSHGASRRQNHRDLRLAA
jgi:hypothetical protein